MKHVPRHDRMWHIVEERLRPDGAPSDNLRPTRDATTASEGAFMTIPDPPDRPALVDAHAHFYDSRAVPYGIFARRDLVFEALVGDYTALPSTYLPDDYLRATRSWRVE